MTGRVLELEADVIQADARATRFIERYMEWNGLRVIKMNEWEEIRRYVYATNTRQTTNSKLPWKNSTTVPKLCQIRDNLYSNYTATIFPKRKSITWEPFRPDANSLVKRDAILNYMSWVIEQPSFKHELDKIILDYIDFGNCFATVEWMDKRVEQVDKTQVGYVGPAIRRISPLDMVMNPTAEDFISSPKFVRSYMSLGELKEHLQRLSTDENIEEYKALYAYLEDIRDQARDNTADWTQRDNLYAMDGFTSFRAYLMSGFVEVIQFYGDWYDRDSKVFEKNRVITIVDRHKMIGDKPNPSFFGYPPIYHVPWRKKQDNLWGMGPLDNLIGMQYRMDHVENMKADVFDLITYPVTKVKGYVQDFKWEPGARIFTDNEGDVELVCPDVNALNANLEIQNLERLMEEMAGAPREAMGFRSPGEKTKYEVQRLENASGRLYQNKIGQFEEQMVEPLLNSMLELARRNMNGVTAIAVFDDDFKLTTFQDLTVQDITGIGRIRPIAARHFAEQAELVQNLTNLTSSGLWQTVQPHFSGIKLARILEEAFDLKEYEVVTPYVALAEQADGQRQAQAMQERLQQETMTATGMGGDYDMSHSPQGAINGS